MRWTLLPGGAGRPSRLQSQLSYDSIDSYSMLKHATASLAVQCDSVVSGHEPRFQLHASGVPWQPLTGTFPAPACTQIIAGGPRHCGTAVVLQFGRSQATKILFVPTFSSP